MNHYIEELNIPSTTQPKCNQYSICHKENPNQVLVTNKQATITFESYQNDKALYKVNMKTIGVVETIEL